MTSKPERQLFVFTYRPPRATFIDDMTEAEGAIIGEHFLYLKHLYESGDAKYVGRCDDGSFGLAFVWGSSLPLAEALLARDPVIQKGLFHGQCKAFRTVFEAPP